MIGQFIITDQGSCREITRETPTFWISDKYGIAFKARKDECHGPFTDSALAHRVAARIKSAMGERDRRLRAAHDWFNSQVEGVVAMSKTMDGQGD